MSLMLRWCPIEVANYQIEYQIEYQIDWFDVRVVWFVQLWCTRYGQLGQAIVVTKMWVSLLLESFRIYPFHLNNHQNFGQISLHRLSICCGSICMDGFFIEQRFARFNWNWTNFASNDVCFKLSWIFPLIYFHLASSWNGSDKRNTFDGDIKPKVIHHLFAPYCCCFRGEKSRSSINFQMIASN